MNLDDIRAHNERVMRRWEAQYMEPPEDYPPCNECTEFMPCPCGCGWGICNLNDTGIIDGDDPGCSDHSRFYDEEE